MSSWLDIISWIFEVLSNLGYSKNQSVDDQSLFGKEQEYSDRTMENPFSEYFENTKAYLESFNKKLGNFNQQHGIGNRWAHPQSKKAVRKDITSNLKNLELQNLRFVSNLTSLLVFIVNKEKSDMKPSEKKNRGCVPSRSSKSESNQSQSYRREFKKPKEFEDENLKKMKMELEIEKKKNSEDVSKRQEEYFQNISSASTDFLRKMKEQSHLEVRRPKIESYRPEEIEELDKETRNFKTKNPRDVEVSQKVPDVLPEKMDRNSSKMDINTIVLRRSPDICSQLVLKPFVTADEIRNEIQILEVQHQNKMNLMKLESAENLKKSDMEFREKLAKEEEENEKELWELDREIEEFERELTSLHGSTYYAYQSVYEGWENVKKLSETFSDRIFLFILLKTLVNVSDKLFNILSCIDYFMNQTGSLENIREEFSKLDTMDIPQTWKLRDQSEIEPLDTLNFKGSPRFYEFPTNVRITEV
ncbi:hypothetical protein B9Z55_008048 [Caenorhabditis nigoni]|uniref:Uncharacterized protein n=1 Tax=Caenorhabditis nigoni TaxID=1611254 RepID=A0A2G5VCH3_9PELO|nr:hypothetical protein B9Z55_008048 [Caenorhabditis nigoni]